MALRLALVAVLTVLLGLTAALAFIVIGGYGALQGPTVLQASWPWIYLLQAILVGLLGYGAGRLLRRRVDGEALSAIIVAAWLGELLILALGLVPTELQWTDFVAEWVLLTGGPIQPTAAIAGVLVGIGAALPRQASG